MTFQPFSLACRTISTEPAVETWQTWRREPTWAASRQSRAMIASSATAGQPGQPEAAGEIALVHLRALGQPRLLGVLGDDAVEGLDVLQRASHQHRVVHAVAVVGEHPDPGRGVGHGAELGELGALEPDGDRADRVDVAVAALPAEPPDLLDDAGGVGDRLGVRHRVDGGVAAHGRGLGAGQHRLGVLASGLAQVGVEVDQAGQRDQAGPVDDLGAVRRRVRGEVVADRGDHPVVQQQVGRGAVEDRGPLDQVGGHASSPSGVVESSSDPLSRR